MLKFFRSLFWGKGETGESARFPASAEAAPDSVQIEGAQPLSLSSHITYVNQLPHVDWKAVESWVATLAPGELQARAWSMCERAWLLHVRAALGPGYRLGEAKGALLLSSLEPGTQRATLDFMDRTLTRIARVLDGVAAVPERGKGILIVLDDHKTYYNYVSRYYPEQGEFALSGGMYLHSGRGHFVTVKSDLRSIEPVIAHEMTHACVAHLPLPAWLNEGIAVNTERRLTRAGPPLYTPEEMHRKHLAFWGKPEIQELWSGKSFLRADDANMLSYDLARIMVEQLSKDWEAFRAFVLAVDRTDSGAGAARRHLGIDLGAYVCAILEKEESGDWGPDPAAWNAEPEKGGFSPHARRP